MIKKVAFILKNIQTQFSKSSDKQPIVVYCCFFRPKVKLLLVKVHDKGWTRMKALKGGVNFCRCEKVKLTDEYSKLVYVLSITEKPRLDFCV